MFSESEKNELRTIYQKSIEVIDSVTMPNGAILASPPNARYPYMYPRDTMLILRTLLELKQYRKVEKTLSFVFGLSGEIGEWHQRYTKDGRPASYRPSQVDCNGLVLYMAKRYYDCTKDTAFLKKNWKKIYLGTRFLEEHYIKEERLVYSMNSIHEWPPMEAGFEIWANVSALAGFSASRKMAGILLQKKDARHWALIEKELRESIMKKMVRNGHFIKLTNMNKIYDADISELGMYVLGLLPTDDMIVRKTADYVEKELYDKKLGGIRRHMRKHGRPGRNNGGYGPYSMYTAWMAQYYLDAGREKHAKKYFEWFIRHHRDGLIPEHVATKKNFLTWQEEAKNVGRYYGSGRKEEAERVMRSKEYRKEDLAYWVVPLTWGHAEFILAYHMLKEKSFI
ncbi:MAG: hypothetical protein KAJ91_00460 [Candidatus Aenigmarchaeota archaeon]|nr:hypothetical protein [Candidatus Aenigmarchaeota archaeon]MCK5332874.1 hypothetical protein [Candidatus Aenigmarchaeota archaeon]